MHIKNKKEKIELFDLSAGKKFHRMQFKIRV